MAKKTAKTRSTPKRINKPKPTPAPEPNAVLDEIDAVNVDALAAEVDAAAAEDPQVNPEDVDDGTAPMPTPDGTMTEPDFDHPATMESQHPDANPMSGEVLDIVDQLDADQVARSKKRSGLTSSNRVEGASFVRMLNGTGHTVAVASRYVPFRLIDGYTFIEGEPACPRSHTGVSKATGKREADNVPSAAYTNPNYEPTARVTPQVRRPLDAEKAWLVAMNRDRKDPAFRNDNTIDWSVFINLAVNIKRRLSRGQAY